MSFWLVQIISVVGVAAVVALTWLVGWSKRARIEDLASATARFAADFPAAPVKGGVVAKDKSAALLELGDGLGLVTVLGDELVTRKLRKADVAARALQGKLILALQDATLPGARIALGKDDLAAWLSKLSSPVHGGGPAKPERGERRGPGSPLRPAGGAPPPQAGEEGAAL